MVPPSRKPAINDLLCSRKKKAEEEISFAETVEGKLRNRNEQLPYWSNEGSPCLSKLENTVKILK